MVQDAIVVMDEGRISAVGPVSQVALPPGTMVMDAGDRTLLPGFIDAHVHGVESIRMAVDAEIDTLEHVPFRAHGSIDYDTR